MSASSRWFACRELRADAALRLYCFTHSGGSAGEYLRWSDHLPGIELWAVQMPGRAARFSEPPITRMEALVEEIVANAEFEGPFALLGHSLGSLVAYEVARALDPRGRRPEFMILSACPAPSRPRVVPRLHDLPDEELIDSIAGLYAGIPAELADDRDLIRIGLPAFRADHEIVETYRHRGGDSLACPVATVGGSDDRLAAEQLLAWREVTTGPVTTRMVPGDHFYFRHDLSAIISVIEDARREWAP